MVGYGTEVRQAESGPQKPTPQSYPLVRRYTDTVGQKLTPQILQVNGNEHDNRGGGGSCFGDSGGPTFDPAGYLVTVTSYGYTTQLPLHRRPPARRHRGRAGLARDVRGRPRRVVRPLAASPAPCVGSGARVRPDPGRCSIRREPECSTGVCPPRVVEGTSRELLPVPRPSPGRAPGRPGREDGAAAADRVAAVRRLESTATGARAVQRLAGLAQRLLGAEAAQISLLGERETVVAGAGLAPGTVGRQFQPGETICAVTAAVAPEPLVIPDTRLEPRVSGLPLVAAGPVVAYLGVPLIGSAGTVVGALCVFGPEPREWSDGDVVLLRQLADSVATELELSALAKEFEASRLRFDLAIDAAGIGSFDYDLLTGELTWDDRLIELFGYDRESFEGTIEAFFAPAAPRRPPPHPGGDAGVDRPPGPPRHRVPGRPAHRGDPLGAGPGPRPLRRRRRSPSACSAPRTTPPGSGTATRGSPGCSRR